MPTLIYPLTLQFADLQHQRGCTWFIPNPYVLGLAVLFHAGCVREGGVERFAIRPTDPVSREMTDKDDRLQYELGLLQEVYDTLMERWPSAHAMLTDPAMREYVPYNEGELDSNDVFNALENFRMDVNVEQED